MIELKSIASGNMQLYYEVHRPAAGLEGEVMIFLHGITVNHTIFSHQLRHFGKQGKGLIAPDQRGDGRSEPHSANLADYKLESFVGDLERIVDAEGVEKAVLVGQSAGGMVAQAYAALHPEKVKKLVLIATSYNLRESYLVNNKNRFLMWISPLRQPLETAVNWLGGLAQGDRRGFYPDFGEDHYRRISDLRFDLEMVWKESPEYLRAASALGKAVLDWDTRKYAPYIAAPALLMYGGSDWLVPPETGSKLQRLIHGSSLEIIRGAGHGLTFQAPEKVNAIMDDFLTAKLPSVFRISLYSPKPLS